MDRPTAGLPVRSRAEPLGKGLPMRPPIPTASVGRSNARLRYATESDRWLKPEPAFAGARLERILEWPRPAVGPTAAPTRAERRKQGRRTLPDRTAGCSAHMQWRLPPESSRDAFEEIQ